MGFSSILRNFHHDPYLVGPYMESYGLVAGLNLDLWLKPSVGRKTKNRNAILKSFLCFTSYKTLWNFRSLSVTELEVRAIGQCLWLPTMCFRSIRELSGNSTRVCELY